MKRLLYLYILLDLVCVDSAVSMKAGRRHQSRPNRLITIVEIGQIQNQFAALMGGLRAGFPSTGSAVDLLNCMTATLNSRLRELKEIAKHRHTAASSQERKYNSIAREIELLGDSFGIIDLVLSAVSLAHLRNYYNPLLPTPCTLMATDILGTKQGMLCWFAHTYPP
ncbi:MAG: hypothetical protein LBF54_04520 [Holosporaceae bacterium]|jgi:hypothetical protein|nr:hypothetical protein [Holosporaceae bacterium]